VPPTTGTPARISDGRASSAEVAPYGYHTADSGPDSLTEPEPPPWPWPSLAPGIIELRPLAPVEIILGAFRSLRYNPVTMLIISIGAILVQTVLLSFLDFGSYFNQSGTGLSFNPLAIGGTLIEVVISTVLTAGIGFVVWHAARGKKPQAGPTWKAINAHIPSIAAIGALTTLVVVPIILGLTVGMSLFVGGRDAGDTKAVLMGVISIVIMVAAVLTILTRIACAPIVAILENATPMQALQRSTRLVRPRFWPTLGTLALAFVPPILIAAIIGYLPNFFALSSRVSGIVTLASIVVFQPYFAAVVALIYIDLRMRQENLPYKPDFVRGHV
jgi:hypothetical protein